MTLTHWRIPLSPHGCRGPVAHEVALAAIDAVAEGAVHGRIVGGIVGKSGRALARSFDARPIVERSRCGAREGT